MNNIYAVIIVGAGPTGLALGNLLGMYGLDVLIIERNNELSAIPRAISLDDEGLRTCQALGLAGAVQAELLLNLEARYISGPHLLARVAPTVQRHGYPLISTFYQPDFERVLSDGLARFPSVCVRFGYTFETFTQGSTGVVVRARSSTGELCVFEGAYLLGCDGAKSTVRAQLPLSMQGRTYAQPWVVVDTCDDPDASTSIRFFCEPERPAVNVPAPGRRRRWEFMVLPGEQAEDLVQSEHLRTLIQRAGGPMQPQITRAAVYVFSAALARSFRHGRVFLLGDAAHLMPPFGGQGLNCGLRDAHNLAWKLWLTLQGLVGPALLASYTRERRAHARQMIQLSRFLGSLIMPTRRPRAALRNALFGVVNVLPSARNFLSEARIKPAPRYRQGFFQRERRHLAGLLLPQPEIGTPVGPVLFDEQLGPGFALLCPDEASARLCAGLTATPTWRYLETRVLVAGNEMCQVLPASRERCVLVRPDRFIYGSFRVEQAANVVLAFERDLRL